MRDSETPGTGRCAGAASWRVALEASACSVFIGLFGGTGSGNGDASLLGLGILMMFGVACWRPCWCGRSPAVRVLRALTVTGEGVTVNLNPAPGQNVLEVATGTVTVGDTVPGLGGAKGSVSHVIDKQVTAKLIVQNQDGFSPIPAAVTETVSSVPGVADAPRERQRRSAA
jgi:putative ABC transport system permease protein